MQNLLLFLFGLLCEYVYVPPASLLFDSEYVSRRGVQLIQL